MKVIRENDSEVRDLRGVRLFTRQNIWSDGAVTYTVLREEDEDELRDEDYDHCPSDAEIMAEPAFRTWRTEAAHAFHDAPELGCRSCEAIDPGTWRERYSDLNG